MTEPPRLCADYPSARTLFRAAADRAGAGLTSELHPRRGRADEALFVDVAWLGPRNASAVTMIVSGTHGIEGYAGSMCQSRWLDNFDGAALPSDQAVLLVHAINPYGFSWMRRVNEDNVDLNRNFVDFDDLPANPDYSELADALAPEEWTEKSRARVDASIFDWLERHDSSRLQSAVSRGQYRHADGIFYGGTAPVWSHRQLARIAQSKLGTTSRVAILDLHTGLGPTGEAQLITTRSLGAEASARASQWWGPTVIAMGTADSVSARVSGDWLGAVPSWLESSEVTGIAVEWGTLDSITVLNALRADNWLHRYGDPTGADAAAIRAQMCEAFAPSEPAWSEQIYDRFALLMDQTLAALAETAP